MDKRRKKSMTIIEHRSSDETALDPFEDDGGYGSDGEYGSDKNDDSGEEDSSSID